MKVFALRNKHSKGAAREIEFGGDHSAGIVIVAEDREAAEFIIKVHMPGWGPFLIDQEPLAEVVNEGIVLWADGEC